MATNDIDNLTPRNPVEQLSAERDRLLKLLADVQDMDGDGDKQITPREMLAASLRKWRADKAKSGINNADPYAELRAYVDVILKSYNEKAPKGSDLWKQAEAAKGDLYPIIGRVETGEGGGLNNLLKSAAALVVDTDRRISEAIREEERVAREAAAAAKERGGVAREISGKEQPGMPAAVREILNKLANTTQTGQVPPAVREQQERVGEQTQQRVQAAMNQNAPAIAERAKQEQAAQAAAGNKQLEAMIAGLPKELPPERRNEIIKGWEQAFRQQAAAVANQPAPAVPAIKGGEPEKPVDPEALRLQREIRGIQEVLKGYHVVPEPSGKPLNLNDIGRQLTQLSQEAAAGGQGKPGGR